MKALHILNGDATLHKFKKNRLAWCVVSREVLFEEPVNHIATYHDFFYSRSKWIKDTYNSDLAEYNQKVIYEFNRPKSCPRYDEVFCG